MTRGAIILAYAAMAFALTACVDRELKPLTPCTLLGTGISIRQNPTNKVDLLFVVDNSLSMSDEQVELANKLKRMIDVLSTGDLEPDDDQVVQSFTPVEDLHVGVISTDMGGGGSCSELGDDGVLRTNPAGGAGCDPNYPAFLSFSCNDTGECTPTQAKLSQDVSCMVQLGTAGCNNEQQLESVLKALSNPETEEPITFLTGEGHGGTGGVNAGFLRDNTVLAVIVLTDEDDCSARDTGIFAPGNPEDDNRYLTAENDIYKANTRLRCASDASIGWGAEGADYANGGFDDTQTGALYPIERYIQGLLKLRANSPDLFVFAAITGVPEDLVDSRDPSGRLVFDYDEILADERMQAVVEADPNPMDPHPEERRLKEACTPKRNEVMAIAPDPARRIVRLAQGLDAATGEQTSVLQSICQEDFSDALDAIIQRISDRLGNVCLPRQLSRSPDGYVNCAVLETLPEAGTPDTVIEYTDEQLAARGREFLRKEGGRNVYEVLQQPTSRGACLVPEGPGWFYDDCSEDVLKTCGSDGQRLRFRAGTEAPPGAEVRLECFQPIKQVIAQAEGVLGGPCQGEEGPLCDPWPMGRPDGSDAPFLRCEPSSDRCQYYCETTADCPNSAFVCDVVRKVCANPTCYSL
ncbi:MAG: hypothetical protein H6715_05805 [Myxococcales bacterium]|nr:hypothetical protein [Myxococcales bacterium]